MCKGHDHTHAHTVTNVQGDTIEASVEENVLAANNDLANENKSMLERHGITAFDFMGAIGSGKTTLIGEISRRLNGRYNIAILNGDATTVDDYKQDELGGAQMLQISTRGECHLDANMVTDAIRHIDLHHTDLMFIENVGNLVCPADFPLGSKSRVVVVSVSEGPYTVRKHTQMFMGAKIAVINKKELADVMEVDMDKLIDDIHTVNPDAKVITTSCRSGEGVDELVNLLLEQHDVPVHA